MQIDDTDIPWNTNRGKTLRDNLILSDNAKKYALAQNIIQLQSIEYIFKGFYLTLMCPLSCGIYIKIINGTPNFKKLFFLRSAFFCCFSLFISTLLLITIDLFELENEINSDKEISKLGHNYIEGAIEYYDKLLKRNQSLRQILGEKGANTYTKEGNVNVS